MSKANRVLEFNVVVSGDRVLFVLSMVTNHASVIHCDVYGNMVLRCDDNTSDELERVLQILENARLLVVNRQH